MSIYMFSAEAPALSSHFAPQRLVAGRKENVSLGESDQKRS